MVTRFIGMVLALSLTLPFIASASDTADALTRQLELNRARYGIAGQALVVVHNGRVIFRGADGEANLQSHERVTTRHVFPAYSLAKLFVSTLIMQLVERGEVDLDAPASRYLPALPPRWQAISVRDLLDHTSGLPEYFDDRPGAVLTRDSFAPDAPALFAALADTPLQFVPGTESRYTQTNYVVLAELLAAHYGKPYPQIAEERIIRKLGLRHTWLGRDRLPKEGVVASYVGKNGRLAPDPAVAWPRYAYGHAELYCTPQDLTRFLQAVTAGKFVRKSTLQQLWNARTLPNGQRAWFAHGWEYAEGDGDRQVGHDGGARDRVRIVFDDLRDGDVYTFIYLANGSARNVWTRTLVNSAMAVVAPRRFPTEALLEALVTYALRTPSEGDAQREAESIRAGSALDAAALERIINNTGYALRENLGTAAALRVFELNTTLFPQSANAWDSLAEAHRANGDADKAQPLYDKARQLSGAR